MQPIGTEGNMPNLLEMPGAFQSYKLPIPVSFVKATEDGVTQTKEGPVQHHVGDAIMTANDGSWPIAAAKFATTYDDNGDGTANKKRIDVALLKVNETTEVKASWGLLTAQPGDYVVQDGNSYWVISASDFEKTYAQLETA